MRFAKPSQSDVETVRDLIVDVAVLELDDGPDPDTSGTTARVMRDDQYGGVRVTLTVDLHTAKLSVKVAVNVGDPIWPRQRTGMRSCAVRYLATL